MDRSVIVIGVIVLKVVRVPSSWLLGVRSTISKVRFVGRLFMMEKLWMKKEGIWWSKLLIPSNFIKDKPII